MDGDGYAIDRSGNAVTLIPKANEGFDVPEFGTDTSTKMLYRGLTIEEGQYLEATLSPVFVMSDSEAEIPPMPPIPEPPTYSGDTLTVKQIPEQPAPYTYGGNTYTVNADGTADYTNIADCYADMVHGDIMDVQGCTELIRGTFALAKSIKIVGDGSLEKNRC